jgi:hypothetical protein
VAALLRAGVLFGFFVGVRVVDLRRFYGLDLRGFLLSIFGVVLESFMGCFLELYYWGCFWD